MAATENYWQDIFALFSSLLLSLAESLLPLSSPSSWCKNSPISKPIWCQVQNNKKNPRHQSRAKSLCKNAQINVCTSDLTGKNLDGTNMCPYSHVAWEAFQWDTGHQPLHQYLSKLQNVFVWIVKYICEMRWWWWCWCWGYWWWAWPWWW